MPANRKAAQPPLYHLYDLWISLTSHLVEFAEPLGRGPNRLFVDMIICGVVYLGTVEKRAMTAAQIAIDSGIPRATVFRRLALIERRGLVKRDGTAWSTPATLMSRRRPKDLGKIVKQIKSISKQLPKK